MTGTSIGATTADTTGPGMLGHAIEVTVTFPFFGDEGAAEGEEVQGSGGQLEVVAVAVKQVFTLGCRRPRGFSPT